MVSPTSPDNISRWELTDPVSLTQESQTQGDSIQAALNRRQRYDYVWPTSAERTAQTGMTQSSRGYQVDTKSEYIYDNSAWRLVLPYAEFTASVASAASNSVLSVGALTLDTGLSTSSDFVLPVAARDGNVTLVNPGIYSITATCAYGAALTGRTFIDLKEYVSGTSIVRFGATTSETLSSLAATYRTSSANFEIAFTFFKNTGGNSTVGTVVRIARLG